MKTTWKEFKRMHSSDNFYGCIDPDGDWFDSSVMYTTAVHWCCMNAGASDATGSYESEAEWMSTEGAKLGYSVIHSGMIKQMYEKGLIK